MKRITIALFALFTLSNAFGARVDTIRVYSNSMHKNIPCVVVVPDGYKKSKDRYPVVYLLHGYSGNYRTWVKDFAATKEDADLYKMIIVSPDGGYSSWYFDSPVDTGFRYETFVTKELIPYIDRQYKTMADRQHRAISGLSMGGHGALYLAIRHKDLFGAANSMSGGVDIRPFPKNWDLMKRLGDTVVQKANWEHNTVINLVDSLKDKDLLLAFDCGTKDFFLDVNRALHQKLLKMGVAHDYTERPGGHNGAYWNNALPYHLLFFHRYFTGKAER
jgi:S-formylglutathione hydrolase FrmB